MRLEKNEFDLKYEKLVAELNKRENFTIRVDDRDTDPDYSQEEIKAEDEKYERYLKEAEALRNEIDELKKSGKLNFYKPFEGEIIT